MKLHIGDTELEIEVSSGALLTVKVVKRDVKGVVEALWGPITTEDELAQMQASRNAWRRAYYDMKAYVSHELSLAGSYDFIKFIDKLEKEIIE